MDSQFDKGLATRKQVMGEDFVANALGKATDFSMPIQQYITRNAWGDVWQRPGWT
jgi:4-carboxymuconolactone decarboxylase